MDEATAAQADRRDTTRDPASTRVVIAAVATLVVIGLLVAFVDAPVAVWVRGHRFSPSMKLMFRVARLPGNEGFAIVGVAALAWVRRRPWRDAVAVIGVGLVASLAAMVLKLTFGRHRPSAARSPGEWLSFAHRLAADFLPGNLSFPSGDATLAFATAATLAYVWPRVRVPAFAWAIVVAITRVLQGVHHPSDVAAGALLGTLTSIAATRAATRWFPRWDRSI